MNRSKLYLVVQTVLCVALAALLAASALSIYREGAARRALDPLESIYTPEIVAARFAPIAPLFFAALGLLIAGLLLGVKDERAKVVPKALKIPVPQERRGVVIVRAVLIVAALALIVAGILNGSARDVLYKAITICTECVGLG